jgi:hypothetical protein
MDTPKTSKNCLLHQLEVRIAQLEHQLQTLMSMSGTATGIGTSTPTVANTAFPHLDSFELIAQMHNNICVHGVSATHDTNEVTDESVTLGSQDSTGTEPDDEETSLSGFIEVSRSWE